MTKRIFVSQFSQDNGRNRAHRRLEAKIDATCPIKNCEFKTPKCDFTDYEQCQIYKFYVKYGENYHGKD